MPPQTRRLIARVGVGSLSSPLEVGADRAPAAARDLGNVLGNAGCQVVELGPLDNPEAAAAAGRKLAESHVHAVALATTSWYEDYLVLDLLEECNLPVLLWALPGMETGALCGNQQITAYLKQLGAPYCGVYGPIASLRGQRQASVFLEAAALKYRLRRARVGLAGHHVAGMTEATVNELALKKTIGPRIVFLDLPELLARAEQTSAEEARAAWQQVVDRAGSCQVSDAEGLDSMRVLTAVRESVHQHRLDALTIGCYPHLMGRVCLAASVLADEGVPLGCEGDLGGAVGQLILTLLTGGPTHNTDWLEPLEDGTVVLTHCGSGSFSLAERPEAVQLVSVRLMGQGVCALFPARPGPVTLANLIPCGSGYQMALLEGEAISTEMVFPGNPLRVRFKRPAARLIEWIHDEGIGHHWMVGYGHVGQQIGHWTRMAGQDLRLLELG